MVERGRELRVQRWWGFKEGGTGEVGTREGRGGAVRVNLQRDLHR